MSMDTEQQNDVQAVFSFLRRHRRILLLVSLACAFLSGTISLMIPKEYESSAVVFPPAALSLDLSSENPNFGYDIEADRLNQILQSTEIRDSVIRKFNLAAYYEVDSTSTDWRERVNRRYRKDLSFKRTTFMSIVINSQTRDPELSANMVNYIIRMANAVREKLYKQNVRLAYTKSRDEYLAEKRMCDSIYSLLQKRFAREGISGLMLLAPSAQLDFNIGEMSKAGNRDTSQSLLGAEILKYRFHFDRQNEFEMKMKRIEKMLEYPIAQIHVLDYAEPVYRKSFPMVSLNVLVSTLLGFVLTCLYLILKPRS